MELLTKYNYSLHDELIKIHAEKIHNNEVVLLNDILRTIIRKKPGIEDFKKLARKHLPGSPSYRLFYKDKLIGTVKFEKSPLKFNESTMSASQYYSLSFTPEFSSNN